MAPETISAGATIFYAGLFLGRWLGQRREARRLTDKERLDGCRGPHRVRGEDYVLVPENYFRELTEA